MPKQGHFDASPSVGSTYFGKVPDRCIVVHGGIPTDNTTRSNSTVFTYRCMISDEGSVPNLNVGVNNAMR